MLIESTRDSLCFSVAHYKHIKQQYGLQVGCCGVWGGMGDPCPCPPPPHHHPQAKSVEEKRVWTHHIKRLILENHHAIVPQKVRTPRCCPPAFLNFIFGCGGGRGGDTPLGTPPLTASLCARPRKPSWRWTCSVSAPTPPPLHPHPISLRPHPTSLCPHPMSLCPLVTPLCPQTPRACPATAPSACTGAAPASLWTSHATAAGSRVSPPPVAPCPPRGDGAVLTPVSPPHAAPQSPSSAATAPRRCRTGCRGTRGAGSRVRMGIGVGVYFFFGGGVLGARG